MTKLARVDVLPSGLTAYDDFAPVELPRAAARGPGSILSLKHWWSAQNAVMLNGGTFSDGDAVTSWVDQVASKLWIPQLGIAAPLIKEDGFNNRRTLFFPGDVARILVNEDGNSLYGPGGVRRTVYWVVRFSGTYISQFAYLGAFEIDGAGNDVIYGFSTYPGYNNFTFGGKAVGGKVPNISSPTFIQNRGMFLLGLTDDGLNITPGSMKLYERGTQYATIAGTDDSDTATKNVLGSWSTNGTDGFNGDICEMLIFDDALSASDLALLDNFFKLDQKAGYFVRDGATSPIFAPGGAASATGFTPNLTNPRLSLANGQNDPGGLLKLGTELFVVYYVDSSGTTMEKWDYSNPASPVLLDTMPTVTAAAPYTITKGPGNLAFVPLYKSEQIAVMDLSKPLSTGACEVEILGGNGGGPSFVWSWGNYFVLANQFFPILYHYSTPGKASQIKFFGGLETTDFFTVSITSDGFLYILASGKPTVSDAHLYVYDMNLLGDIPLVAELSFTGQNFNAVWMEAVGNRLCFTDYANNKVHILDITNRNSTPTEIAAFAVPTGPIQVGMFGNYIAVACQVAAVVDFWDISTGTIVPGDAPTHLGSIAASQNVLQSMCLDLPNKLLHVTTAHPTGGEGVFSPNTIETWSLA